MNGIVFSTIWENIRSFFQKEEELTAKPKAVPEAASEIYGKPGAAPQRIVEKPLPQKLPFSPDDLRQALKEKETPAPAPQRPVQQIERDITHEISAFESALHEAPQIIEPVAKPRSAPPPIAVKAAPASGEAPFFDEFEQFLHREDLDAEGILEKDILWRMKEFHKHRQGGKEYYLYGKDVQAAVNRKLGDLKELEREWFSEREQADAIEKRLTIVEHEIELRTTELRELLRQAKQTSRLEHAAPAGQEFILADGRKLASLLDLKLALKTMPETVFSHHVTSVKNDFATWARNALGEQAVADEMGVLRDKPQLEIYLAKLGQ